jgi:alpha-D-xyloside xylohydrolase
MKSSRRAVRGSCRWLLRRQGWSAIAVAVVLAVLGPRPAEAAEPAVLESGRVRLEVTAEPYGYRLLEKGTSQVVVEHGGVQFGQDGGAARAVKAGRLRRQGGSIAADLVTADGQAAGRARFRFEGGEVLVVELAAEGGKAPSITQELRAADERYYGLFEYPFGGRLDNAGLDADLLGVGRLEGVWFASGRAPFYLTSRKHGVYVRSSARSHYTVAVQGKTSFRFDGPSLRYDIIYGPSYQEILARYTKIAGPPAMPPLWAFGSAWWSDDFNQALHHTKNAQENVLDLADKLAQHQIPAGAICLDRPYGSGEMGWGNMDFSESFPDPKQMLKALKEKGLEVTVWVANRAWNRLHQEAKDKDLLFPADPKLGPALDLRKPAAYALLRQKLDTFVQLGIKGYKIDRGEQGEYPDAVQNENVTLFQKLAHEGLTARHRGDVFSVARNVYDTGRKYTAVWNGDTPLTFQGLRYSVLTGLRSGLIAMPMWGSDTGGYVPSPAGPTEELFARWLQFSAFSPVMEVLVGGQHTPWYDYPPRLVAITRAQAALHHELIPYTRSFMYQATVTGAPIMRPLFLDHPDDEKVATLGDQYLYGSELLVAPVLQEGATSREVYLPAGRWIDYHDRRTVHDGGKTIVASAPFERIPVFAREGAIVPRGDILRANNTWTPSWAPHLRVEVFPGPAGKAQFAYYDGRRVRQILTSVDQRNIAVQLPDLGVPTTAEIHLKNPGKVLRNGKLLTAGREYHLDPQKDVVRIPSPGAARYQIEGDSLFALPAR